MGPMSRAVCLCASSSNQNKALTGAAIFMQGGLRLCCPARPGTFLVTLNHCLFTLSQELNELRLWAHPGKLWRPHPTLPPTPHPQTLYSLQPPPTTTPTHACSVLPQTLFLLKPQLDPWESVFLFTPYLWQIPRPLWLHHSNNATLSAVLRRACRLVLSAAVDLFKHGRIERIKEQRGAQIFNNTAYLQSCNFSEILFCTLVLNDNFTFFWWICRCVGCEFLSRMLQVRLRPFVDVIY